ncbi:MAG TPA: ArdC-like ssDNA-binding domain-containing protein, partial [Phycisphaerae bacterium]|nr:ArdC-like ssDNA-binding domain-containing protein [Phycisphaerae bacterium]
MKAEQAKKIADQALEQLADALAHGKSEALTRYLAMLAKFHKYSFGNVLMILSQKPDATHVAGFHTWRQMGRFV